MDEPCKVIGGFPLSEEDRGASLFRGQVASLKGNILAVVRSEVAEFHRCTGLSPDAITIRMVDVAQQGYLERVVGGVDVRFEL